MRILVVGSGGVGGAIPAIAARRDFVSHLAMADVDPERARAAAARFEGASHHAVDARDRAAVVALAESVRADVLVNACDPRFNPPLFGAAFDAGITYLDMAMTLSAPGVLLGQEQFDAHDAWTAKGLLALVGMGVEPGLADVFARYAQDHLFSKLDEVGVRDGSDLRVEGYDFAPTFSIWTTIEECLNPPLVWERERGHYTTEPFTGGVRFTFPEGIGELECVDVEHEEVVLIPRWVDCEKVTFKYGLGDEFVDVLKTLHKLGLDSTDPLDVRGVSVAPRDVVAAALPDPATLGDRMTGRTCAGTWCTGTGLDGQPREVYLHHVVDNAWSMAEYGAQAVVWQTAINPVVALECVASGAWTGAGVLGPEALDPMPFLELLTDYGSPWGLEERTPTPRG